MTADIQTDMNLSDKAVFDRAVAGKVQRHSDETCRLIDRLFIILMLLQWAAGIVAALVISPRTWIGAAGQTHPHVFLAIFGGGILCSLPVALAIFRPGKVSTRMVIACSQVLFSSLLIHLTGGRIETHFHVFGSLAILAAYRDWRVLIVATVIVAVDHFARGVWWPESVFGVAAASQWRWLEHAGWVVFEDVFLLLIIRQNLSKLHELAENTTRVELTAQQLRESAEQVRKLSLVASKAKYGVIIADPKGRIEWVNQGFMQMTGYCSEEVCGKHLESLLEGPHVDPETIKTIRRRMDHRQGVSLEFPNCTKHDVEYWMSLEIDPVFSDDKKLTNFIATQTNISERKAYESELRRAKDESESANRAKTQFLANMSHEIRTPLNGILGFTELLRRTGGETTDTERQEYLEAIGGSGRHLATLINDILDISKIESGFMQVERLPCSPHALISEISSVLRVAAREKDINLDYRWESGIPEFIYSDPHRIKQLLLNLIGNAIKFTEQGTVLVVASLEKKNGADMLRLEVRDTGIGIPQEKFDSIFAPFTQADSSVTRRYGGTGLGLSISKSIAEALGGQLSVTSDIGRGSVFTVVIAAGDLSDVPIHEKPLEDLVGDLRRQEFLGHDLEGLKILLVEDGDTNRKLIRATLARAGADVVTAENGKIALQLAAHKKFDLALMDMQMPVMDGYTATRILRERGFAGPVVALTAHAMQGDRQKCEAAGCSGYLSKPIDMDELIQAVLLATNHKPRRSHPTETNGSGQATAVPREVRSLLPTDDPEIRAIVVEFVDSLNSGIEKMDAAKSMHDYDELARLAHWLKGAGGTVGFDCFTEPARQLEKFASDKKDSEIGSTLEHLRSLEQVLVV
jgi:PAS domain S-box-containing protein